VIMSSIIFTSVNFYNAELTVFNGLEFASTAFILAEGINIPYLTDVAWVDADNQDVPYRLLTSETIGCCDQITKPRNHSSTATRPTVRSA
jgi:hypothetical protein